MKAKALPSVEYLRECFTYNPKTGSLKWKVRPQYHFATVAGCNQSNSRFAGKLAGPTTVSISGEFYKGHRIAWALYYGEDPGDILLDHKDLNDQNNRIKNLRKATSSQNMCNTHAQSNSKSGVKGVCWAAREGKWLAQVNINGKKALFQMFPNLEDAVKAVERTRNRVHKEFANHA